MGAIKMFMPYDMRPTIEVTAFTLTALSTLIVATRFYCRIWIVGKLKLHDHLTLGAVLSTWALCACNHYQLQVGSGARGKIKDLTPMTQEQARAYRNKILFGSAASWYAYHVGYLFTLFMVKLSILVFYLSFATSKTFKVVVHITIVLVTTMSASMILVVALQCPKKPLLALSPGILIDRGRIHCFDLRIVFYWQAGFNMISDLVILVLPMPLLCRLHMRKAKRLSLLAVFSVGLLVPVASGIRIWGLYLWANSGKLAQYSGGYVIFWSQVELNTAIICASAPSLQPLLKQIFHKLPPFLQSRGPYYYYGGGRNATPPLPNVEVREFRPTGRDSISDLEPPALTYKSKPCARTVNDNRIIILNFTDEEEVRARVRAFSSHACSTYSQPTSPTYPAHTFTNG